MDKVERLSGGDDRFVAALSRARHVSVIAALGLVVILLLVAWATYVNLHQDSKISDLEPRTAGGAQTCSGGNLKACDRVCVSTAARLIIVNRNGEKLSVGCHHSTVTSEPGHEPAAIVFPHNSATTSTRAPTPAPAAHPPPKREPSAPTNSDGTSTTDNRNPQTSTNPIGNAIQTVKTVVCTATEQLLGKC